MTINDCHVEPVETQLTNPFNKLRMTTNDCHVEPVEMQLTKSFG